MMHANSMKTAMGGLALLLLFSGCSSGPKTRTASNQPVRSPDVVTDTRTADDRTAYDSTDRMSRQTQMATDRPVPLGAGNRRTSELTAACSHVDATHVDASGKLVYDDPNDPDRTLRPTTSSSENVQDPASYDRQVNAAWTHALKAEGAGDQGNIPEMLRHARLSFDQARGSQRARTDPYLNAAIMDLKETLILGCRNEIAPAALRDARAKLSRAAYATRTSARTSEGIATGVGTRTVRGELVRDQNMARTDGGEHYMLRDTQNREMPISLSPEMSRQVAAGDTVDAQIDSNGQVVAISKSQ